MKGYIEILTMRSSCRMQATPDVRYESATVEENSIEIRLVYHNCR